MSKTAAFILSALALLIVSGCATRPVNVVLLGGQSNMAGCGNYNALSDADKARVHAVADRVRICRGNNARQTPPEPLSYYTSAYQLKKRGFAECFGPELFIGVTLAEAYPKQEFLLIKTSVGGTSLYGVWNPEWSAENVQAVEQKGYKWNLKLYHRHRDQIQKELARLHAEGKPCRIIGMAWMQGENDAAKELSARSYKANLKKLIAAYRADFNRPDMPFVAGQINSLYGDFPQGPSMVRQAFVDVAQADPNVTVIKTKPQPPWDDFPKHDDQVHYNHEGQKRLGTAMGKALLDLSRR